MNRQMSKSQKRKQRLLNKGAQLASKPIPTVTVALPQTATTNSSFGNKGKSRSARRRSKRRSGARNNAAPDSYLKALINPESAEGAKVPDAIGYPTGTFQLEKIGTLTAGNTSGDSVAIQFRPVIGDNSSVFPIVTYNGTTSGSLTSATSVGWPSRSGVIGLFGSFRPVSASLEVSYFGSSSADAGRLVCGTSYFAANSPGTTFDTWSNNAGMSLWPSKNGARVVWKPIDNTNYEFTPSNVSWDRYPSCCIAITGLVANQSTFQYRVIANFEAIPLNESASLIETKPSPVSLESLNRAFRWAQEAGNAARPLVGVVGTALEIGMQAYGAYRGTGNRIAGAMISKKSGMLNYPSAVQQLVKSTNDLALEENENNNNRSSSSASLYNQGRDVSRDQTPPSGRDLGRTSSGTIPRSPLPEGRFYQ